ncbi:hypothetical protein GMA19_02119 [Paenibacillus polymyxa E681]|uniref:hypothetical protein n=1 Tax=Paenibacillus polymyxa TaxID=1406 RepID=UPI0001E3204E|nr:hypothetical protein [Paenibacillus polymyxa]ADM69932.1 hypothetical protein PPE_02096 [Paenibacillus polymyxa E681]QNV56955.1 hypothetical protein GE561_02119 [Paenibacillus polymyxa E681]QNV61792.1 hypothetical protein GMA19_02119 [Paenibacillus polymyxa E681]
MKKKYWLLTAIIALSMIGVTLVSQWNMSQGKGSEQSVTSDQADEHGHTSNATMSMMNQNGGMHASMSKAMDMKGMMNQKNMQQMMEGKEGAEMLKQCQEAMKSSTDAKSGV